MGEKLPPLHMMVDVLRQLLCAPIRPSPGHVPVLSPQSDITTGNRHPISSSKVWHLISAKMLCGGTSAPQKRINFLHYSFVRNKLLMDYTARAAKYKSACARTHTHTHARASYVRIYTIRSPLETCLDNIYTTILQWRQHLHITLRTTSTPLYYCDNSIRRIMGKQRWYEHSIKSLIYYEYYIKSLWESKYNRSTINAE